MIEFKATNMKMIDIDTSETISEYNLNNAVVETEVDTCSLSNEKLSFTHEATFDVNAEDISLLNYVTDFNDNPLYIEYNTPIMIQSRWHKKKRINKKWLKRYGMKKDSILIKCDVESISPNINHDPYYLTEHVEYGMTLSNMQYKFRQDQLRKNLKIEVNTYGQY